jgi:ribonuclease Z
MNALKGVDFQVASTALSGFSVSGLATWMIAPELDVCFDMGECPISAVPMNHVLLTHAHGDHSRCLMRHHALRKMLGIEKEATYYIPHRIFEQTKTWIRASAQFEGVKGEINLPHIQPLKSSSPSDEPQKITYRKNLSVRAFYADHGVPSLGYTLYDSRLKLKSEFMGRAGHELAELKRRGVQIQTPLHTPRLTFIGDCTAETLWREHEIWESKILVIESTFIGHGEERLARQRGHTHLNEIGALLRERGDEIACEAIILKHFSMKIKPVEALIAALKVIPPSFHERVYLMTHLPKTPSGLSLAELSWRDIV